MGIIEKFNDEFGIALDLENSEMFKNDGFLTMGASSVAILFDWREFENDELVLNKTIEEINWKPFTLREIPKDDFKIFMETDKVGFKWFFIERAINTIEPNEYSVIESAESHILALKNGHYVIMIAPVEFEDDDDFEFYDMIDINKAIKKPTGEAFAL